MAENINDRCDESGGVRPADDIRVPKRALKGIALLIVLGAIVLGFVRGHVYQTLWGLIVPASAQFTVTDSGTATAIDGATITVNRQKLTTDGAGRADAYRLWVGKLPVTIEAPGYVTVKSDLQLHRGPNAIDEQLVKDVRTVTFRGKVTDYVSDQPLADVGVKTADATQKSAADGSVTFEKMPVGTVTVTLTKDGYRDTPVNLNLVDDSVQSLAIVPSGATIFTSNRDGGKRGLFVSDYAGKTIKPLLVRSGETEDYSAVVGPNNILAAFLSTRDKRAQTGSSYYDPTLYLIGTDGTNLKKLTDDSYVSDVAWSPSGKLLAWRGNESGASAAPAHGWLYDPIKQTTTKLDSSGQVGSYWFSHQGSMIAWTQQQANDSGEVGLFLRDLATGAVTKLIDRDGIYQVEFNGDDTMIEYQYYDSNTQQTVYQQYELANGATSAYTPEPNESSRMSFTSPDGKYLAYTDTRDGQTDLFLSDVNATNEQRLTRLGTLNGNPVWDKSGRYLLVDSTRTGETARYIVGVNGGTPKKIADISIGYGGHGY